MGMGAEQRVLIVANTRLYAIVFVIVIGFGACMFLVDMIDNKFNQPPRTSHFDVCTLRRPSFCCLLIVVVIC
jgi:hypothetical protein